MTAQDRRRWDQRYADTVGPVEAGLPAVFRPFVSEFPTAGHALELACGRGQFAVWLARRGMSVSGFDVSPIAIGHARELARRTAVDGRCRFDVLDLDDGLPDGPAAHVIVCHKFRDARLDQAVLDRLAPGGLLAISALSEVGSEPGPFHARPGELLHALGVLEVVSAGEGDGLAWLLGRHGDQST